MQETKTAKRSNTATLLAVAGVLLAATVEAQPGTPQGAEMQVNTYTPSAQGDADVAYAPDGSFVVVWDSYGSAGTDNGSSIQMRRFASDGTPLGDDVQVNTHTTDLQVAAAVDVGPNGDFVVAWMSYGVAGTDNDYWSIRARRFLADGSPLNDDFQVNTYTTDAQRLPSVAVQPDGAFVIVWDSGAYNVGPDGSSSAIRGQRFTSGGSAIGGELQVNGYTTGYQAVPRLATNSSGGFVVTWESYGSAGTDTTASIQARRFDAAATPIGDDFQVNAYTTGTQGTSALDFDDAGNFVIVWSSFGSAGTDGSYYSVQGRRFAADGTPNGGEFQVNTYTTSLQYFPAIGVDGDGDFVVVWHSFGSFGDDDAYASIQARQFAADGTPLGDETQVNTYTPFSQALARVARDAAGRFVVVWHSFGSNGDDDDLISVQAQRFSSPGCAVACPTPGIFCDGFECGNTSGWSLTVP